MLNINVDDDSNNNTYYHVAYQGSHLSDTTCLTQMFFKNDD